MLGMIHLNHYYNSFCYNSFNQTIELLAICYCKWEQNLL